MNAPSPWLPLDLLTVKIMTLVNLLIVSGATLHAWRVNRPVKGMRLFALGTVALWTGSALGLARGIVPGSTIIIACNVLMLGGMVALVQGIRTFRELRPISTPAIAILLGITSVFYFYWMFVHDSFAMRVAAVAPAYAILSTVAAVAMIRGVAPRDRAIYWPAGFSFALSAIGLVARLIGALHGSYGTSMLSPVPVEILAGVVSNVSYVGCAFGMLLASNTTLRRESEKMALYDPLTNLPNRRLFFDRLLEAEMNVAARREKLALIYLDLDGFKGVNDTQGHQAGDDLLRSVSAAMSGVLTSGECLARMGGDEFVVLIERPESREKVAELASRLKRTVEDTTPIRISSGIAVFPEAGSTAHDVLREADAAMYQAKRSSRASEDVSASAYLPV